MNVDFDGWIERELHAAFAGMDTAIPEPGYRKVSSRRGVRLRRALPVVLGGKLATGLAITCLAGASSVAATTVLTGSPDPFTLVHHWSAPASVPDPAAPPAAPGGGAGAAPTSTRGPDAASTRDPAHTAGGANDTGAGQGGGVNGNGHSDGNAPATPPGQTEPHGGIGGGTGGGKGHTPDASNPTRRYAGAPTSLIHT